MFSGIKHILSQRAVPYHSYICARENESYFHLKFSKSDKNFRIDDHHDFLQIVNLPLELACYFWPLQPLPLLPHFFLTGKRFVETYLTELLILELSIGQAFSVTMSTSPKRSPLWQSGNPHKQKFPWLNNFKSPNSIKSLFFIYWQFMCYHWQFWQWSRGWETAFLLPS